MDPDAGQIIQKTRSHEPSSYRTNDSALESETEDESTHIALPDVRKSKYTGNGYDPPVQDLGPHGGNTPAQGGYLEERGYGVPILASDEVAKTPGAEFMQPAVSPMQERRGSNYYTGVDGQGEYQSGNNRGSRSGSASNSRPTSRPGSIHSSLPNLSRFSTYDEDRENLGTPLEDVDEYEPLFPDEDGNKVRKPMTPAQRMKMRDNLKRFPSQDIWEDTPNSLQLQATVETPEAEKERPDPMAVPVTSTFETAEQEGSRKGEVSEAEKAKLISREERLAQSNFKPHIQNEMHRPRQHRFPSRDVWEDSPDSANLSATVGETPTSPPDAGLEAGAVVQTSGGPKDGILAGEQPRDNVTVGAAAMAPPSIPPRPSRAKPSPSAGDGSAEMPPPSIPARPPKRLHQVPPVDAQVPIAPSKLAQDAKQVSPTEARKPILPERSKPQVPARPSKPVSRDSSESTPLSKVTSASSAGSQEQSERDLTSPPGAPKPKPAIPARPAGGKIANLKAGFMGDLESRLKLGPQAPLKPKEPEPEEEKAPLESLTKGRARGPAKRKPVPTAAAADRSAADWEPKWQIQQPWTVWQTDDSGAVGLGKGKKPHVAAADPAMAAPVAKEVSKEAPSLPNEPSAPILLEEAPAPMASNEAPAPILSKAADGPPDSKDMEQAKLAVEESLHASEPLSQSKVEQPAAKTSPHGTFPEPEDNPSINETLSSIPLPSSTVTSPTMTNEESQTGQKDITLNPGTADEQKMTAIIGGDAQSAEDSFSRETHV